MCVKPDPLDSRIPVLTLVPFLVAFHCYPLRFMKRYAAAPTRPTTAAPIAYLT